MEKFEVKKQRLKEALSGLEQLLDEGQRLGLNLLTPPRSSEALSKPRKTKRSASSCSVPSRTARRVR